MVLQKLTELTFHLVIDLGHFHLYAGEKLKSLVKCVNVVNLAQLKVARFVSACGKSNLFICTGKKPIAC